MYSQKGDVVLDPFMGLGTTALAAILSERNSVGFEIVKANSLIYDRYKRHLLFVDDRVKQNKEVKYDNDHIQCKVMTKQETDLTFHYIKNVELTNEIDKLEFKSNYLLGRRINDMPIEEKGTLFE